MNVGMLWFDNDPRTTLPIKVARAAAYYRQKYGHVPDLCMVHPSMLPANSAVLTGTESPDKDGKFPQSSTIQQDLSEAVDVTGNRVVLRPTRLIMPGHLWIGQDKKD